MLKSLFCEDISVEYEFKSVKFKGLSIDLKMNNLDLNGNTTEFKTLLVMGDTRIFNSIPIL